VTASSFFAACSATDGCRGVTSCYSGRLVPYLLLPFDLVPDLIPVVGQLDDAILVAWVLRRVVRGAGPQLIEDHWPGPPSSLALMLRLAGVSA
jgi:uncharacterized membrane protein YkvA (DUF1232 family)